MAALTSPDVWLSNVFKSATANVVSDNIQASSPKLLTFDNAWAVFNSAVVPSKVSIIRTLTVPEVKSLILFKTLASKVVLFSVILPA